MSITIHELEKDDKIYTICLIVKPSGRNEIEWFTKKVGSSKLCHYGTIYINPRHIGGATIRSYSENPELYNDMAKKESVKFIKQRIREREKQGYNQRDIKML